MRLKERVRVGLPVRCDSDSLPGKPNMQRDVCKRHPPTKEHTALEGAEMKCNDYRIVRL